MRNRLEGEEEGEGEEDYSRLFFGLGLEATPCYEKAIH
jgi:hypothetical protein